jgi:hypothetical protein
MINQLWSLTEGSDIPGEQLAIDKHDPIREIILLEKIFA